MQPQQIVAAGTGTAGAGNTGVAETGGDGQQVSSPGNQGSGSQVTTGDGSDASNASANASALESAIASLTGVMGELKGRDDTLKKIMMQQVEALQEFHKRDAGRAKSMTSAVTNLHTAIWALDSKMDTLSANVPRRAETPVEHVMNKMKARAVRDQSLQPPLDEKTRRMDTSSGGSDKSQKLPSQHSLDGSAPSVTRVTNTNPVFDTFAYTLSGSRRELEDSTASKLKPTKPPAFDGDCTKVSDFFFFAPFNV